MIARHEPAQARFERFKRVVAREPLPCAIVDLDALEANVATLTEPIRANGKRLRVASKSIRCPSLLRRIMARAGDVAIGVMTYAAREGARLAEEGFSDLLLAYPVAREDDAAVAADTHARLAARGGRAAVVVDCAEHVALLERAARERGTRLPIVVDVDVAWRPLGRVHVGVRRSPLRGADAVVAVAARAADSDALRFEGVLAYEAQIAGVPDRHAPVRVMKRLSVRDVAEERARVVDALAARGLPCDVVNGGGTGSVASSSAEPCVSEVTVGSGFVDSHLFDGYRGLALVPAAYFAVAVARRASEDIVTCHGGGWIASGRAGADRLPIPALPEGLRLLAREGAGEVQTPLVVPRGVTLALGDPVFFRHAKAGELAEHVNELLLVRGDRVEERGLTYRGLGDAFLG